MFNVWVKDEVSQKLNNIFLKIFNKLFHVEILNKISFYPRYVKCHQKLTEKKVFDEQ